MGSQWSQVVKDQSKTNPGIADYTKCQSGVFMYSSFSMIASKYTKLYKFNKLTMGTSNFLTDHLLI